MCFDAPSCLASKHFIQDLKDRDPKLEGLLERARNDDGDALFAGSLVLLGGFDLASIDEVEATEWTRRGALLKYPACSVAYGLHLNSGYAPGRRRDVDRYVVLGKKWLLETTRDQSQPCALMLRAVVEEQGLGGFRRSKVNASRLSGAAAGVWGSIRRIKTPHHQEGERRPAGREQEK